MILAKSIRKRKENRIFFEGQNSSFHFSVMIDFSTFFYAQSLLFAMECLVRRKNAQLSVFLRRFLPIGRFDSDCDGAWMDSLEGG